MNELMEILRDNDGIVIGENHATLSAIKFLIDNAAKLRNLGVTHVFTERFTSDSSFNQYYPDYLKNEDNSNIFRRFISDIDRAEGNLYRDDDEDKKRKYRSDFIPDEHTQYTISTLIKTMKQHGIQLIGIDEPSQTLASDAKNLDAYSDKNDGKDREKIVERKNKHMKACVDKEFKNPHGKSIIMIGAAHAGDYLTKSGKKVQGLASRLHSPSVYLFEDEFDEIYLNSNTKLKPDILEHDMTVNVLEDAKSPANSAVKIKVDHVMSLRVLPDNKHVKKPFQCIRLYKNPPLARKISNHKKAEKPVQNLTQLGKQKIFDYFDDFNPTFNFNEFDLDSFATYEQLPDSEPIVVSGRNQSREEIPDSEPIAVSSTKRQNSGKSVRTKHFLFTPEQIERAKSKPIGINNLTVGDIMFFAERSKQKREEFKKLLKDHPKFAEFIRENQRAKPKEEEPKLTVVNYRKKLGL